MNKYFKQNLILLIVIISFYASGQTTTGITAGGEAIGSDGTLSYSVGQVFYLPINDTDANSVIAGVQQAYEISEVSGVAQNVKIKVLIFPNPSSHLLTIDFGEENIKNLQLKFYDSNGKLLLNKQELSRTATINMEIYTRGTYYLTVIKNNQNLRTYKIIKN